MERESRTDARPVALSEGASRFPWISAVVLLVACQLAAFTLLRVAFYALFRDTAGDVSTGDVLYAGWLGLRFDLRLALLLVLPLLTLTLLPHLRPTRRAGALLWRGWIPVAGMLLTAIYAFDLGHYDWLHERLDAKVLDELRSPREAAGMIWESYPVLPGLLGLALIAFAWNVLGRMAVKRARRTPAPTTRAVRSGVRAVATLAILFGLYGNLSWYPLRWSQAFFDTNPFVAALASNPALYFFETLGVGSRRPDRSAVDATYERVAELLEVEPRDRAALAFARTFRPAEPPPFVPNLVVIHMESWAAFQTGMFGATLPSSPQADALAAESLLFRRFFVPSGPTARSVFSMLTGIPDIPENNTARSASRDPGSVRQPTLVNALTNHEKHYFLGGSANWANIRALFAGNIPEIVIHEEGSYDAERVDVWGISDVTLFEAACETLDAAQGPFFAFLQTSGNHAPYTIPDDTDGFERSDLDDDVLLAAGFKSREAYDGFRFLDHALGHFFELARTRPWYRDTVFAIYGDHGVPSVNGVPFERIGIVRHHVPLLIHAPRLVPAGRVVDTPASSLDILPTCLALMGVPYVNTALGRDALRPRPAEQGFAFLSNGLILGDWFWRHERDGRTGLFRYASEQPEVDHLERDPERARELATTHAALKNWALWAQHDAQRRLAQEGALQATLSANARQ